MQTALRYAAGNRDPQRASTQGSPTVARGFLMLEATTFAVAAAVHFEFLLDGYGHLYAAAAETVIALVLLAGLALTRTREPWPLRAAAAAQGFAVVGVLIGLAAIAVGVGPQTAGDLAYHLAILVVLAAGLAASVAPSSREEVRHEH